MKEITLETGIETIRILLQLMKKVFSENGKIDVFDEFVIIIMDPTIRILYYESPRKYEEIQAGIEEEIKKIEEEIKNGCEEGGHFHFEINAPGYETDGFIVIGDSLYCLFNYTKGNMIELSLKGDWLAAQKEFKKAVNIFSAHKVKITP